MAVRLIYDASPDRVALFEELFEACERDQGGEPLGDVTGHAVRRFTLSYMVLCLCRLLRDLGRIDAQTQFTPAGARHQDKKASGYTQAAHVLPCDIRVEQPGGGSGGLYDLLQNGFNRTWVQRNVFAETDRVHRLTNLADRYCESGGMIAGLVDGCRSLAADDAPLDFVFWHRLTPAYQEAARRAEDEIGASLSEFDRAEGRAAALRDHLGRPLLSRPSDVRIGSPDAQARAANRAAVLQVLRLYRMAEPDRTALHAAAGQIEALRHNEGHG